MAYKVALLSLLLAVGCSSMASARTLANSYPTDDASCSVYHACGWHADGCSPNPKPPTGVTAVAVIVTACLNAIAIGKVDILVAVVAVIKLIIAIDIALCAAVIVALIAEVTIKAKIVAQALVQICALVSGDLIVKLIVALGVDVLVELLVALGLNAAITLLLPLCALIRVDLVAYLNVLAGCCNRLYIIDAVGWPLVIAKVCVQLGVTLVAPLLQLLTSVCLKAVLNACLTLGSIGKIFVCGYNALIGINLLGILCISIGK